MCIIERPGEGFFQKLLGIFNRLHDLSQVLNYACGGAAFLLDSGMAVMGIFAILVHQLPFVRHSNQVIAPGHVYPRYHLALAQDAETLHPLQGLLCYLNVRRIDQFIVAG